MQKREGGIDLSIIIPFYNVKRYFTQCLDSVLNQDCVSFELVLVNDGSNDGSEKIAAEYALKDKRIILFNQENKGIPFARNKGLELINGKYFLFIDADDYIAANSLKILMQTAIQYDVDILQTEINRIYNEERIEPWKIYPVEKNMNGEAYFKLMIRKHSIRITPYSNLVRTEFAKQQDFVFDEKMTRLQDFEYYTKLMLKANKIRNINYPYYYFRVDSNTEVKKDRHNISKLFQLYHLTLNNFDHFSEKENLSRKIKNKLHWLVCSHVSYYKKDTLNKLPDDELNFWKDFVKHNIFRNNGWLRPYVYFRFLKFLTL